MPDHSTLRFARYEEGTTVLRKEVKASDFVWSEKPLDMLGSITSMSFKDPDCKVIKEHDLTTDEVYFSIYFILFFVDSQSELIHLDTRLYFQKDGCIVNLVLTINCPQQPNCEICAWFDVENPTRLCYWCLPFDIDLLIDFFGEGSFKQIKILCEDLRVLGKTEFKQLLK